GKSCCQLVRLRARDGAKWRLVLLTVPDGLVIRAGLLWPRVEDDAVENGIPLPLRDLDHAVIGEEFREIAAHGLVVRGIWRTKIGQQDADTTCLYRGMPRRQRSDGFRR